MSDREFGITHTLFRPRPSVCRPVFHHNLDRAGGGQNSEVYLFGLFDRFAIVYRSVRVDLVGYTLASVNILSGAINEESLQETIVSLRQRCLTPRS